MGAGLFAKAVCQLHKSGLTHRLREQARSHSSTECFYHTAVLCLFVGTGLPAMQATRSLRYTEAMLSQASQLPHLTVPALALDFDLAFASHHSSRPVGRCAVDLLLILILGAPLNHAGRTQVVRSG